MIRLSFALENQIQELQHTLRIYEQALKQINTYNGKTPQLCDRDILIEIANSTLDKINPHRGCPKCGEDCIGWVSEGISC